MWRGVAWRGVAWRVPTRHRLLPAAAFKVLPDQAVERQGGAARRGAGRSR